MGFSRQEYWSGFQFPIPGYLPHPPGFPGGASSKEYSCQCRRCKRWEFDPWVGKIPWRRAWQPTLVFLPGKSHEQMSLNETSQGLEQNWTYKLSATPKTKRAAVSRLRWQVYIWCLVQGPPKSRHTQNLALVSSPSWFLKSYHRKRGEEKRPTGTPGFSVIRDLRTSTDEIRRDQRGLPWWLSSKEPTCRRHWRNPWSRKIPQALEQLSPCDTTINLCSKPESRKYWTQVLWLVKPSHPTARVPQQET